MKNNKHNMIIYRNKERNIRPDVHPENETVLINRQKTEKLFDRDVETIGKRINNVFDDDKPDKNSTVANFLTVKKERDISYINYLYGSSPTAYTYSEKIILKKTSINKLWLHG